MCLTRFPRCCTVCNMSQKQSIHSKAFIGVHRSDRRAGTLIYVIIEDRAAFDLIDLPEGGNETLRHKVIDDGKQYICFQLDESANQIAAGPVSTLGCEVSTEE
jgi:hypothetical protein